MTEIYKSDLATPTYTKSKASFEYLGDRYDEVNPGSDINARNSDVAGDALRLRNPSGELILNVPSTGFKDVILSYATTRTGSGSLTQSISYTTDGTTYTQEGLTQSEFAVIEDTFVLIQLNFSGIEATDNNPNFKVKIEFDEASSKIENGNNRIDNLALDGISTGQTNPEPEPEPVPQELVLFHYWNFNDLEKGDNPEIVPNVGNGTIEYFGNYYDRVDPGSDVNVRNEDEIGYALRLRNESGALVISIPTTGYKNVEVKYAATRTGKGSKTHTISYTIDGTNYIQTNLTETEFTITEDDIIFSLYEIDFSAISGVENNQNFKIKIDFDSDSAEASSGNNRIDNLTVEGNTL